MIDFSSVPCEYLPFSPSKYKEVTSCPSKYFGKLEQTSKYRQDVFVKTYYSLEDGLGNTLHTKLAKINLRRPIIREEVYKLFNTSVDIMYNIYNTLCWIYNEFINNHKTTSIQQEVKLIFRVNKTTSKYETVATNHRFTPGLITGICDLYIINDDVANIIEYKTYQLGDDEYRFGIVQTDIYAFQLFYLNKKVKEINTYYVNPCEYNIYKLNSYNSLTDVEQKVNKYLAEYGNDLTLNKEDVRDGKHCAYCTCVSSCPMYKGALWQQKNINNGHGLTYGTKYALSNYTQS